MTAGQSPCVRAWAAAYVVLWRQHRWGGTCGNCSAFYLYVKCKIQQIDVIRVKLSVKINDVVSLLPLFARFHCNSFSRFLHYVV